MMMLVSRSARNFLHFWSNTKSRVSVVVVVFFFLRCSPNTNFQLTAPFRDPVDWKAWKLFDYPKLIKHPMDMATVQVREILQSPPAYARKQKKTNKTSSNYRANSTLENTKIYSNGLTICVWYGRTAKRTIKTSPSTTSWRRDFRKCLSKSLQR